MNREVDPKSRGYACIRLAFYHIMIGFSNAIYEYLMNDPRTRLSCEQPNVKRLRLS
jgi:hypothetical protein